MPHYNPVMTLPPCSGRARELRDLLGFIPEETVGEETKETSSGK